MLYELNYPAIVVAAAAGTLVGSFWYSSLLFGKAWLRLKGLGETDLKDAGRSYVFAALSSVLTALVLSFLIHLLRFDGAFDGMNIAFWCWLGFVATAGVNDITFGNKPFPLFVIETGHQLISLLGMGAILGAWY